jgi:hypothetical protein
MAQGPNKKDNLNTYEDFLGLIREGKIKQAFNLLHYIFAPKGINLNEIVDLQSSISKLQNEYHDGALLASNYDIRFNQIKKKLLVFGEELFTNGFIRTNTKIGHGEPFENYKRPYPSFKDLEKDYTGESPIYKNKLELKEQFDQLLTQRRLILKGGEGRGKTVRALTLAYQFRMQHPNIPIQVIDLRDYDQQQFRVLLKELPIFSNNSDLLLVFENLHYVLEYRDADLFLNTVLNDVSALILITTRRIERELEESADTDFLLDWKKHCAEIKPTEQDVRAIVQQRMTSIWKKKYDIWFNQKFSKSKQGTNLRLLGFYLNTWEDKQKTDSTYDFTQLQETDIRDYIYKSYDSELKTVFENNEEDKQNALKFLARLATVFQFDYPYEASEKEIKKYKLRTIALKTQIFTFYGTNKLKMQHSSDAKHFVLAYIHKKAEDSKAFMLKNLEKYLVQKGKLRSNFIEILRAVNGEHKEYLRNQIVQSNYGLFLKTMVGLEDITYLSSVILWSGDKRIDFWFDYKKACGVEAILNRLSNTHIMAIYYLLKGIVKIDEQIYEEIIDRENFLEYISKIMQQNSSLLSSFKSKKILVGKNYEKIKELVEKYNYSIGDLSRKSMNNISYFKENIDKILTAPNSYNSIGQIFNHYKKESITNSDKDKLIDIAKKTIANLITKKEVIDNRKDKDAIQHLAWHIGYFDENLKMQVFQYICEYANIDDFLLDYKQMDVALVKNLRQIGFDTQQWENSIFEKAVLKLESSHNLIDLKLLMNELNNLDKERTTKALLSIPIGFWKAKLKDSFFKEEGTRKFYFLILYHLHFAKHDAKELVASWLKEKTLNLPQYNGVDFPMLGLGLYHYQWKIPALKPSDASVALTYLKAVAMPFYQTSYVLWLFYKSLDKKRFEQFKNDLLYSEMFEQDENWKALKKEQLAIPENAHYIQMLNEMGV